RSPRRGSTRPAAPRGRTPPSRAHSRSRSTPSLAAARPRGGRSPSRAASAPAPPPCAGSTTRGRASLAPADPAHALELGDRARRLKPRLRREVDLDRDAPPLLVTGHRERLDLPADLLHRGQDGSRG